MAEGKSQISPLQSQISPRADLEHRKSQISPVSEGADLVHGESQISPLQSLTGLIWHMGNPKSAHSRAKSAQSVRGLIWHMVNLKSALSRAKSALSGAKSSGHLSKC